MNYPYKSYPNAKGGQDWSAVLNVQIANYVRHSPPTKRFEALIDSGASRCIFHSDLGRAIGLDVPKGEIEETVGVDGVPTVTYLHGVPLYIAGQIIKIRAGFTDKLPLSGLLGRSGFFEHFKITFDPSCEPPGFELQRIHKV